MNPEELYGTWKLIKAVATDAMGRELPMPYGPNPMGTLTLERSGRMMAVLCDGRKSISESEKRPYSSYCGNFQLSATQLITTVDAAAVESRIGSKQIRDITLRDGLLTLRPPRREDGEQRELVWEYIGPA